LRDATEQELEIAARAVLDEAASEARRIIEQAIADAQAIRGEAAHATDTATEIEDTTGDPEVDIEPVDSSGVTQTEATPPPAPVAVEAPETVQWRAEANGTAVNGTAVDGARTNGTAANGAQVNGHANGTATNGTAVSGAAVNGHANGTAANGTALNGAPTNGTTLNGAAVNGHANGISVDVLDDESLATGEDAPKKRRWKLFSRAR
jgi:hypothetical protein